MVNENDGRVTSIPNGTIGKIIAHQGYDISTIISDLKQLYETSIYGWSEKDRPKPKETLNNSEYRV